SVIVAGCVYTDIVGSGFPSLTKGEAVFGQRIAIRPGGKSRNIAQMIAAHSGAGRVAMIGRTTQDPYGLWRLPVDALLDAGVDCSCLRFVRFDNEMSWPGITLSAADKQGRQQFFIIEGVSGEFSPDDIENADRLFRAAGKHNGMFVTTLEPPLGTAIFGIQKARQNGLKVLLDPAGMKSGVDYASILQEDIFLLKPNAREAEILSGQNINDIAGAQRAALKLRKLGPQNVLITLKNEGAVLASGDWVKHLAAPDLNLAAAPDSTGCGDQVMATVCALLLSGEAIEKASELAVRAGTLQYFRPGVVPVRNRELVES
ncbi:MAG TPA: PfkB family carbohydrate kinase, partial [Candidatus Obscuribacterales bacterium]